jgi:hypothetical protein
MVPRVQQLSFVRALGVDTIATITAADAAAFKAAGFSFVVRYLGAVTSDEVDVILAAGLAFMPVGYSRKAGWLPTGDLGDQDGSLAFARARLLGLPTGTSVWCDLEGMSGTAANTIAYAEAWGERVEGAGYVAGVYVGAGIPLNSTQLYALNNITAYWHSCSEVPNVSECGYTMIQLTPPDLVICGVEVDVDVIQKDRMGRLPVWTVQGSP